MAFVRLALLVSCVFSLIYSSSVLCIFPHLFHIVVIDKKRSLSKEASVACSSSEFRQYLEHLSSNVATFAGTTSPNLLSSIVVLTEGKRPNAHFTANCRCLFW